ncbi:MAG: NirD/YgiW/YdeI family stress tolerance protein [Alphaproteobacteria bacterium]|nr:NirD/YgiW/YdeI family stress tolerance protein [Alphaproteobacteria bacterium]
MKKTALLLLSWCICSGVAMAGFDGPRAPSLAPTTVQQALTMRDDTVVVLTGHIVHSLGDEKYLFRDDSGEVIIEIDDEDWRGVTVKPEDLVEIVGKVDKEFMERTKIDVETFSIK